jgi:hypothetical protein
MVMRFISGARSGTLTDAKALEYFREATAELPEGSAVKDAVPLMPLPVSTMRGMWTSERGKALSERWIAHQVDYDEYIKAPMQLVIYEYMRRQGLPADAPSAADDEVWKVTCDLIDRLAQGRLDRVQATQFYMATKGVTGVLGWGGVSGTLDPETRGVLEFLLGHRAMKNRKPEAAEFLQMALADLQADSVMRPLAEKAAAEVRSQGGTVSPTKKPVWQLLPGK